MRWLNNGQAMVPFIDALTIICVNGRITSAFYYEYLKTTTVDSFGSGEGL